MQQGWIQLHRKLLDWEWYDDSPTKDVFIHLLLIANHEDKKWHGKTIARGSCVTSIASLQSALGLSARQIRTALEHLKKTGEIDKQTTNQNTTVLVLNYDVYQSYMTSDRQSADKQATTNNNDNNVNNDNKEYIERGKSKRFIPPTLQDVQTYIDEKGYNISAEKFVDFYSSKNWYVGKNKMADWKAAVRSWQSREKSKKKPSNIDSTYNLNEIEQKAMFTDDYDV